MMFATSIKNPLEAETVGQRRERKAKEPEGSTRSSRSSFSARRETKSTKSSKFSVFEAFSKTPKTRVAPRDDRLESNVKQHWNVSPPTLPTSPGPVPPDSPSSVLWPHSQGYCELSTSPSVRKPKSIARCPRLYVVHANKIISRKIPILRDARTGASPRNVEPTVFYTCKRNRSSQVRARHACRSRRPCLPR
jgi:hypothetical protein